MCGQLYPLPGIGATIDIMPGVVDPLGFLQFFDGGWEGFVFFEEFFEIDGLIAELPEMVFGIVLIAICKEVE